MKEYNAYLENYDQKTSGNQPNGVSEDPRNEGWGHRTEMEPVDTEHRQSVSQRVNERQAGEEVSMHKKDHGKCGSDASNENDDKLVEEKTVGGSLAEKEESDE